MTLKELRELIRIYGGDRKMVDVLKNLKFIAEMGTKLKENGDK